MYKTFKGILWINVSLEQVLNSMYFYYKLLSVTFLIENSMNKIHYFFYILNNVYYVYIHTPFHWIDKEYTKKYTFVSLLRQWKSFSWNTSDFFSVHQCFVGVSDDKSCFVHTCLKTTAVHNSDLLHSFLLILSLLWMLLKNIISMNVWVTE